MNIKTLEEIKEEIFKAFSVPKEHFDKRVIIGNEFEEWLKEKRKIL